MLLTYSEDARRALQQDFLAMLPAIERVAIYAFRAFRRQVREDHVAATVAIAFRAFKRLVDCGRQQLAYPSVLAWLAVRQVRAGRRIEATSCSRDILSARCQRRHGFQVEPLGRQAANGQWEELLVEDRHSTPAEIAAVRLDFRDWLRQLDRRRRAIAIRLATGESTSEAARRFGVSRSRISQCRVELKTSWQAFQCEGLSARDAHRALVT